MSKGKLLAVCLIWLTLFGIAAVAWRLIWVPQRQRAQADAERSAERERLAQTGSSSAYDVKLHVGLDSFSGYAILRTAEFRQFLAAERIDLELVDDQANYALRLTSLDAGSLQMAAFPIDSLIIGSAQLGKMPATIVGIIDETRGADAMVAYRETLPSPDSLNDPDVRFVLTPSSPSEMLLRLMQSQFRWDRISENAIIPVRDANEVVARYRNAKPNCKEVYVTWEPYVSEILENNAMVRVIDSARFKGYIVDCLVVSRDFLIKYPEITEKVVEAYFHVLYQYRDEMKSLVMTDAATLDSPISPTQADKLVEGIWWKNTLENFEHFGIAGNRLQLLEDMLKNVTRVLLRTHAIDGDPTHGKPNELVYRKVLEELRTGGFHPNLGTESIRNDNVTLPDLTDRQWQELMPVGELEVEELVFARGQAVLTDRSHRILDELADRFKTWPQYYLLIRGNASQRGNLELNQQLATQRAQAALEHLARGGIAHNRIKAVAGTPSGQMSVSFVLGQPAY